MGHRPSAWTVSCSPCLPEFSDAVQPASKPTSDPFVGFISSEASARGPGVVDGLPADVVDVAVGEEHALACTRQGELYAWGLGAGGKLGTGDTNNRVMPVHVTAAPLHQVRERGMWRGAGRESRPSQHLKESIGTYIRRAMPGHSERTFGLWVVCGRWRLPAWHVGSVTRPCCVPTAGSSPLGPAGRGSWDTATSRTSTGPRRSASLRVSQHDGGWAAGA
jgi:hypothetical protein